jgi:hypothetical protein
MISEGLLSRGLLGLSHQIDFRFALCVTAILEPETAL